MDIEKKIELARCILVRVANMNMKKEFLLKISERVDCYIIEYYRDTEKAGKNSNKLK